MPKKSAARKFNKESHSEQHRARKPGRGEKPGKVRDSGDKNQGKIPAEASKSKDGCFPKLSMLLLPFVAAGAYFFLRS
jgi:hypothetical protein